MPKSAGPCSISKGFTLVELIVVIAIVGIGWFGLVPNLDMTKENDQLQGPVDKVNEVMASIRLAALTEDKPQVVRVALDSNGFIWNKELFKLPLPVTGVTVNGEYPEGMFISFLVYRSGVMDNVNLQLAGNVDLVSRPLEGLFAYENPEAGRF